MGNEKLCCRDEGELVGILLTYAGGVVMHKCKTLRCKVSCSQESEGAATEIGRQFTAVARDVCRALGDPQLKPTFVATDNLANSLVAMDAASASKSRHFLRRYYCILQDVKSGDVRMGYVPDKDMPADFLTKWVSKAKLDLSLAYLTNARARERPAARAPRRALASSAAVWPGLSAPARVSVGTNTESAG